MSGYQSKSRLLLLAACFICLPFSTLNAALVKSYDFNGDLSDTLGAGVDLAASGGSLGAGRYSFLRNQGLQLTSALPSTTDYAIEMRLQVNDNLNGYKKLIDFENLNADTGLYLFGDQVEFYNRTLEFGNVFLDTDFTIGLARSGNNIQAYLNGALLFDVADLGLAVSSLNILNFFEDDVATSKTEAFAGSVDFIRIHDDASTFGSSPAVVPIPAAFWLFAGALAGLAGIRKRLG